MVTGMKTEGLHRKATITKAGAILLGKYVVCDGTSVERSVGVLSHAHTDHLKEFESSLAFYNAVLVSPPTRDLLIADRGNWLQRRRNLIALPYKKPFNYENERITLYPVNHVLGSSQVLLENSDGTRIVYTGDFNYPNTPILESDILILDATYGDPKDIRQHDRNYLVNKLVSLIREELQKDKPAYIFSWSGKLQCLMSILSDEGVDTPFLAIPKDVRMANVYKKYGMNVGNVYEIGSREAYEIQKTQQPFVAFHRIGTTVPEAERSLSIRVSACMAKEDFYEARKNYYVVALSDHADFNGLLEYVKQSRPKLVVTDSTRFEKAATFAQQVKKRLGIDAKSLP